MLHLVTTLVNKLVTGSKTNRFSVNDTLIWEKLSGKVTLLFSFVHPLLNRSKHLKERISSVAAKEQILSFLSRPLIGYIVQGSKQEVRELFLFVKKMRKTWSCIHECMRKEKSLMHKWIIELMSS